nr:MAG TPA: hypothetical protein [Caudoviricetes sp.]
MQKSLMHGEKINFKTLLVFKMQVPRVKCW